MAKHRALASVSVSPYENPFVAAASVTINVTASGEVAPLLAYRSGVGSRYTFVRLATIQVDGTDRESLVDGLYRSVQLASVDEESPLLLF